MGFSFTVVADICEGTGDCVPVCPAECIHWTEGDGNEKGTRHVFIDAKKCINCWACQSVCPIEGAILAEWHPEYQRTASIDQTYTGFRPEWRTGTVLALAKGLREDGAANTLAVLGDALQDAGCDDAKLLAYCRGGPSCSGRRWVADLILVAGA